MFTELAVDSCYSSPGLKRTAKVRRDMKDVLRSDFPNGQSSRGDTLDEMWVSFPLPQVHYKTSSANEIYTERSDL